MRYRTLIHADQRLRDRNVGQFTRFGCTYTLITQGERHMLSKDQFAEMNARLEETERREKALMQALRDRLSAVDQKLLEDVRNIGLEHEGRRTMILTELQSLAERVGAFPPDTRQSVRGAPVETLASPRYVPQSAAAQPIQQQHLPPAQAPRPAVNQKTGDWRQAAERIRQDIESQLNASIGKQTDPWAEDTAQPAARVA